MVRHTQSITPRTTTEMRMRRAGSLGICASAGYVAHAAATTPLIHSVALVAPWLHDREIVEQVYGGAAGVARLEAAGAAAEAAFRASERQALLPAASMQVFAEWLEALLKRRVL